MTHLVQERQVDHVGEGFQLSATVDVLHGQDALVVVLEVDFIFLPTFRCGTAVAPDGLFVCVLRYPDLGDLRVATGLDGRDPGVFRVADEDVRLFSHDAVILVVVVAVAAVVASVCLSLCVCVCVFDPRWWICVVVGRSLDDSRLCVPLEKKREVTIVSKARAKKTARKIFFFLCCVCVCSGGCRSFTVRSQIRAPLCLLLSCSCRDLDKREVFVVQLVRKVTRNDFSNLNLAALNSGTRERENGSRVIFMDSENDWERIVLGM